MTLHAVGTYGSNPGSVVVFLHGWGSDENDLASLARYLPNGLAWASVRAPLRHPSFGYAWYELDSPQSFGDGERIAAATQVLWDFLDAELSAPTPLIPVGFSQGGLMASQLLRTRPERIPAAAILSGYVSPGSLPSDAALAAVRPPVFWGRGGEDVVIPDAALAVTEAFLPLYTSLEARVYEGLGHSVSELELAHLTRFLTHYAG